MSSDEIFLEIPGLFLVKTNLPFLGPNMVVGDPHGDGHYQSTERVLPAGTLITLLDVKVGVWQPSATFLISTPFGCKKFIGKNVHQSPIFVLNRTWVVKAVQESFLMDFEPVEETNDGTT